MKRQIIETDIPRIQKLMERVLGTGCYAALERLGGLTNRTYHVTLENGKQYIVRIPGEGTEEMIARGDEKISTELACRLGLDARMLYFGAAGEKVTEYIPNAQTMTPETLQDKARMGQMAEIFRTLHTCGRDTGVPFEVFRMAENYEKIIEENRVPMFSDYREIKEKVMDIKAMVDSEQDIKKVPCHNDALCANWVLGDERMYLIDWEYAGMNDSMWDLAEVSLEAEYDKTHDMTFLALYLGKTPGAKELRHFAASKIYVDFLWTLWAKTRVPYDGQPMEDWAAQRYARMKENILAFHHI